MSETRVHYDQLAPKSQGYVWYMEAEWNREIPKRIPYKKGTPERREFDEGANAAMFSVLDGDDE